MKATDKHAYLIIAHNDPYCFHKLISLLDDKRNDIYVHIDKKSDINLFNNVKVKYSNIYFTNRIDVQWGFILSNKNRIDFTLHSCIT